MKQVLVTGGTGFIGSYVVDELAARGHEPVILDRHILSNAIFPPVKLRGHYFGDIKDATLVTDAVAHVDGVIHLAGVLGTQETIANPLPAAETNVLGGLNVIQACAQYDVPLVNIAVGNYWENNTYSISKNTVERFVEMTRKYIGAPMASVRAFNAYGPGQVPAEPYGPSRVRKIMPSFICRALTGLPIEVYGDGDQIMDMIYVQDVARALVTTLEYVASGNIPEVTVEAGTGRATTVNDIAEIVRHKVAIALGKDMVDIDHLLMRPGESERSIVQADATTLNQIGMSAHSLTRLETGVEDTIAYFQGYLEQ